jgi:predicted permease
MEGVFRALEGIFEVLFMLGIGFVLAKKGWFTKESSMMMTKLVMKVSLPLFMIVSISKNFTHDSFFAIVPDLAMPFASIFLAYIVGRIAVKLLHIRKDRQGVFCTCFFIANTIFIGLPVNLALFGDQSVPSVMLYYMANMTMFWTLGVYHIMNDSAAGKGGMPLFSLASLKKVCSPPLMGFIVGIILLLLNITLPDFILTSFRYVGNLATPLSLIVIGIEMAAIPLSSVHWDRDIIGALVGRFIVCPLCVIALLPFIPVSPMSMKVFTMQASMPVMTQMTIVAKSAGADVPYTTALNFLSVLLGLIVIPIYMFFVQ